MTTEKTQPASRTPSLTDISDEITAAELDTVSGGFLGAAIREASGNQTPTETISFTFGRTQFV